MTTFPYTLNPAEIPTAKVLKVAGESAGCVLYACPDDCWTEHHKAWCLQYRNGNKTAPQPMPSGHLCFKKPTYYSCVPYGCTNLETIRAAHEYNVRGLLDGWDRDLTKEQLDKIVNATVEARMKGKDVGAAPFMACIYIGAGLV